MYNRQQIGLSAFLLDWMLQKNSLGRRKITTKVTKKTNSFLVFQNIFACGPMKTTKNSFHISDSVKALPSLAFILFVNRQKSAIKWKRKKKSCYKKIVDHNEFIIEITNHDSIIQRSTSKDPLAIKLKTKAIYLILMIIIKSMEVDIKSCRFIAFYWFHKIYFQMTKRLKRLNVTN